MIENKRINNLIFRPAIYLIKPPKNPAWTIDKYVPNEYYGNENKYIKEGNFYISPDTPNHKIHKNCFKNKEYCFSIASFEYNESKNIYELVLVGDRVLDLDNKEWLDYAKLITYGNEQLNGSK